jgi:ankyrin repeat protein
MKILDEALLAIEKRDLENLRSLAARHPYVFHFEAPYGWPVLHRCMAKSTQRPCVDLELVKLFVANGGNVNQRTDSGVSLLFLATVNGFCVKMGIHDYLTQCGASMSRFEEVVATLMSAAEDRRVKALLTRLLKDHPALVKERGDKGMTLLHHAVRQRQFQVVPLLLDGGADPNAVTSSGRTPLGLCPATEEGIACRKVLISRGARLALGEEVVELIRDGENEEVIKKFESSPEMLKAWVPDFGSFLHIGVWLGKGTSLVQYLLDHELDPNIPNEEGRTALFLAVDKPDVAEVLMQRGADVNWRDNYGSAPLHLAVTNSEEVVRMLVDRGADVNALANDGMTPFDVIYANKLPNYKQLARYLQSRGATSVPGKLN